MVDDAVLCPTSDAEVQFREMICGNAAFILGEGLSLVEAFGRLLPPIRTAADFLSHCDDGFWLSASLYAPECVAAHRSRMQALYGRLRMAAVYGLAMDRCDAVVGGLLARS